MDTAIIVGIFTLAGTLAGVAIGAGLNYIITERSRRRERMDLTQENVIDANWGLCRTLRNLQIYIRRFKRPLTKTEETSLFDGVTKILDQYDKDVAEVSKAYLKAIRYVKKGPISESSFKIMDELERVFELSKKFLVEYPKSKSDTLNELENQIKKAVEIITKGFGALRAK